MRVFIFALLLLVVAIEEYKYSSLKKKPEKAMTMLVATGTYITQLKTWRNNIAYLKGSPGEDSYNFLINWANKNVEDVYMIPFISCCTYIVAKEKTKNPYTIISFYLKVKNHF